MSTFDGLPLVRTGTPWPVTNATSPSTIVAWIVYVAVGSMGAPSSGSEKENGTAVMSRSICDATMELSVALVVPFTRAMTAKASALSLYGSLKVKVPVTGPVIGVAVGAPDGAAVGVVVAAGVGVAVGVGAGVAVAAGVGVGVGGGVAVGAGVAVGVAAGAAGAAGVE